LSFEVGETLHLFPAGNQAQRASSQP